MRIDAVNLKLWNRFLEELKWVDASFKFLAGNETSVGRYTNLIQNVFASSVLFDLGRN